MKINSTTKISEIIKAHPDAMEAIISISSKFTKLRNPILRKIMASRTSVATACKVAGCSVNEFLSKLTPLGFSLDNMVQTNITVNNEVPDFLKNCDKDAFEELDVRPIIEGGKDPFNVIMQTIKQLPNNKILKLINSFEPAPLIPILNKQGFESYVEHVDNNTVNTYFKSKTTHQSLNIDTSKNSEGWEEQLNLYKNNLIEIDVRQLEMPMPMMTILEELDTLPTSKALFVHHKRIPVFLLPELKDRNFEYLIKEISESEVQMLIFKN
ncbi:MAG: DUF2249 domain-containing protein [Bacteroidetes bacterium]|nr:DUF2249 domain-containing protein [Bacteroidota bacterium]